MINRVGEPVMKDNIAIKVEAIARRELIKAITEAVNCRASEVHFTLHHSGRILIQHKTFGIMGDHICKARLQYEWILSYVKFHAALDLAQPMQPQSGDLRIVEDGEVFSCRVSILPGTKFQGLVLKRLVCVGYAKKHITSNI